MKGLIPLKPICKRLGLSVQHETYRVEKLGLEVVKLRYQAQDGKIRAGNALSFYDALMWLDVISQAKLQTTTRYTAYERRQITEQITSELFRLGSVDA